VRPFFDIILKTAKNVEAACSAASLPKRALSARPLLNALLLSACGRFRIRALRPEIDKTEIMTIAITADADDWQKML
jgi:hypothetical protein